MTVHKYRRKNKNGAKEMPPHGFELIVLLLFSGLGDSVLPTKQDDPQLDQSRRASGEEGRVGWHVERVRQYAWANRKAVGNL